ncbi:hypothetical protein Ancab_024855 [Ancistrocladus abbreviatus]
MDKAEAQVNDNFSISTNKQLVYYVLQFRLVGRLIADEEVTSYAMKAVIKKLWKLLNEEKYKDVKIEDVDYSCSHFWIQLHNIPWKYLSIENVVIIGNLCGEVLRIDDVSEDRLLDKRFLTVKVLVNVFFSIKKHVLVTVDIDKEIKVLLKYEHMSDFCFNCKMFGQNGYKCGNPKVKGYSAYLKAIDMSDKNACFLPVVEILYKMANPQGDMVKEQEQGIYGGRQSHDSHVPQTLILGHKPRSFEIFPRSTQERLDNGRRVAMLSGFFAGPMANWTYFSMDYPVLNSGYTCVA